jgi:hypothetical protein
MEGVRRGHGGGKVGLRHRGVPFWHPERGQFSLYEIPGWLTKQRGQAAADSFDPRKKPMARAWMAVAS